METNGKTGSFESSQSYLFERLSRHLAGDGIYWDISPKLGCSYINYWLNDQIERNKINVSEDNFNKFKNFSKSYDNDRKMLYRKESCEGYLKPIYYEYNYNRKKSLYEMYDWYNLIQIYDARTYKKTICDNYALINRHYRNLIESYTSDDELIAKLDDFIKVINKSEKSVKRLCEYDILPPSSRQKDSKQAPDSQGESISHSPKETSGHVTQTRPDSPSELLVVPEVAEPHAVESHTEESAQLEPTVVQSEAEESPKSELSRTELEEGKFATGLLPGLSQKLYRRDQTFGRSKLPPEAEMMTSEYGVMDTDGYFTSIQGELPQGASEEKEFLNYVQDTFSSIVQNVDPAPVLGVSGGMGVLFILFKVFKVL
ncbi:hypothetical protein PVIIG_06166 [Plasmodium vivax India VII]|uniref:VIR protein n=1 Tax=Plasmodium vivax India VII TaxID=1077284 RepID=A0A0J9SIL8_PLAVI|nr:hypothetical protein PVIIG_06166 [Plasmodium vivax India VII]